MTLYVVEGSEIIPVQKTTFAQQSLRERSDLQKMLRQSIDIISPDTLIVAEEFGEWEDSRRRIDLLGIDKEANLIVIELKRTEDGGHMELQSIRYAAMISTLTFEKLVPIYAQYLRSNQIDKDASQSLLEFLDWNEPDEDTFAKEVKIILASAEFSKELTSSVMWLNDFGINIKCVRMNPYVMNGKTLLDIQTVIPIPEAADYQIRIREKKQKEREARTHSRDLTKFNVSINGKSFPSLNKRWMMFHVISETLKAKSDPETIIKLLPSGKVEIFEGTLNVEEIQRIIMQGDTGGVHERTRRFFCDDGEFFHFNNKTYVFSNQWSGPVALPIITELSKLYPDLGIELTPVE